MFRNIQGVLATYILVFAKFPAHLHPKMAGPKPPTGKNQKTLTRHVGLLLIRGGDTLPCLGPRGGRGLKTKNNEGFY